MYVSNDVIWKRQNGRWDSFQQDKANLEKSKGSNLSFPTTSREFLLLHMRSHFNGSNGKKEEEQESSLSTLIQISFLLVIGMAVIGIRHILVAQSKEQEHKEVDSAKQRNEPVESLQVIPI